MLLLALMLVSAFFMQRQMTKANPTAAQAGGQAALMKYMPLIYVVWGYAFPAGLVLYWTTANGIQIAQQTVMLRAGHIGPDALERAKAEQRRRQEEGGTKKKGFMAWMNEKAQAAQGQQDEAKKQRAAPPEAKGGNRQGKSQGRRPQQQPKLQQKKPSQPPKQAQPKGQTDGSKGDASGDGSSNGRPNKPVKGAKPGNQLRPKKKP